jgi:hypothetical protein
MADVKVHITDAQIIRALNTPGGAVFEWSKERADQVRDTAVRNSPVNDPLDAVHRGGVVGVFKASWATIPRRHGHQVGFVVLNAADHAPYVEFGRTASTKRQRFSWRGFTPPGDIRTVTRTAGRDGKHILRDAANTVGTTTGDWGPLA